MYLINLFIMAVLNLTLKKGLEKASNFTNVTMKDGLATLKSVSEHTSKNGVSAKLVFSEFANPEDETKGHVEYLSTSKPDRFIRVIGKLLHLANHSANAEAKASADFFNYGLETIDGDDTQPLSFRSDAELKEIQDGYGIPENNGKEIGFMWYNDYLAMGAPAIPTIGDNSRIAVKFTDRAKTNAEAIALFSKFIGESYVLKVSEKKNGFQNLEKILPKVLS